MYYSKYNIYINDFPLNNGVTIYNLINKSMVFIEDKDQVNNSEAIDEEILTYMKKNKIVFLDESDEKKYITEIMADKYNIHETLEVIIVTTRDCNLSCIYCFEGDSRKEYMSMKLCKSIVSRIKKDMVDNNYEKLNIKYYGGEPLLNIDVINYMSDL